MACHGNGYREGCEWLQAAVAAGLELRHPCGGRIVAVQAQPDGVYLALNERRDACVLSMARLQLVRMAWAGRS